MLEVTSMHKSGRSSSREVSVTRLTNLQTLRQSGYKIVHGKNSGGWRASLLLLVLPALHFLCLIPFVALVVACPESFVRGQVDV